MIIQFIDEIIIDSRMEAFKNGRQIIKKHTSRENLKNKFLTKENFSVKISLWK